MKAVEGKTVLEMIELSRLLGEFGQIKRVTLLPNGDAETDSHHSFALALVAYEFACQYAPELDKAKIVLYSLVHDLSEIVTGDMVTLTATDEELEQKAQRDANAIEEAEAKLACAPHIVELLKNYEQKVDDEALFVFWVDKMITIPTHFYDQGANLKKLGMANQSDIQQWYKRTLNKLSKQSREAHWSAVQMFEMAYQKMHDELLEPAPAE